MSEGGIDAGEPGGSVRSGAGTSARRAATAGSGGARDTRPEGARPRSGLDRVARSRSDAPGTIVPGSAVVSIFGTIVATTVYTMSDSVTVTMSVTGIGSVNIIGGCPV